MNDLQDLEELSKIGYVEDKHYALIFELYKKYIDPSLPYYKVGCDCDNSVINLYYKLINYYRANKNQN